MADSERKGIVKKGDTLAGSIHTLSDLKHLSSCMTHSLKEFHINAQGTFEECSLTNTLLKQIFLICAASTQTEENITQLTRLEEGVVLTKKIASMTNDDMNVEK